MQYLANGNSQKSDLMKKLLCNWICKWRGWSPKCAQREWVQGDQPNQNKMEWRYPNHLNMLACKWQWSLTSQNLLYQKTGLAEYEPPTVWGDCHQSFCAAFCSYCVFALSYAKTLFFFFKSMGYIVYAESKQTLHCSNMPFQIMTYCQNTSIGKFPLSYIWRWGFILTGSLMPHTPYGPIFRQINIKMPLQMDSSSQK